MDKHWLENQFRLNPEKSKSALARALGLEAPAISKILGGGRQIKAHEYIAMRRFFGLPVDGDRAIKGRAATSSDAYVLQPLQEKGKDQSPDAWTMPASLLSRRTSAPPGQVRVFQVEDNSMEPDFLRGEHVLVDTSDIKPSPPGVFLISDGIGHYLRQCEIMPQSSPVQVRLRAKNETYNSHILPLKKAGLAGRVIAKLEWL